jgi:hypothetical protein
MGESPYRLISSYKKDAAHELYVLMGGVESLRRGCQGFAPCALAAAGAKGSQAMIATRFPYNCARAAV